MSALATYQDRLQRDVPLAKYTAARLGGPADWLYVARADAPPDELQTIMQAAWDDALPVRVVGGGANILVSDAGFRGLIVVNRLSGITFTDDVDECRLAVRSGTSLSVLARQCALRGVAGMSWAVGVPGTIGGAVVNNAGAHGDDMSDSVLSVQVLEPDAGLVTYSLSDMAYGYRTSSLKQRHDRRYLVLGADLHLPYADSADIQAEMDAFNAYRKRTQPPGASLGSIFKNPPGDYAGRLIEASGLKGARMGGVQVSPVHANFIVNDGDATAADYYALIEQVREAVAREQGVHLELEIELIGWM